MLCGKHNFQGTNHYRIIHKTLISIDQSLSRERTVSQIDLVVVIRIQKRENFRIGGDPVHSADLHIFSLQIFDRLEKGGIAVVELTFEDSNFVVLSNFF
ncbi:hypothetical protein PFISCL1PPCAC_18972, partial [Pristionchus fissidentatus]